MYEHLFENSKKVCLHSRSTSKWTGMSLLSPIKEKEKETTKTAIPNIHNCKYISLNLASTFLITLEGSIFSCSVLMNDATLNWVRCSRLPRTVLAFY